MTQQNIIDAVRLAISRLEQPNNAYQGDAFAFLLQPAYDFSPAINELRAGLQSPSDSVKIACASAVGQLAGKQEWAVEELKTLAIAPGSNYLVAGAAVSGLMSLGTASAAKALGEILTTIFPQRADNSELVRAVVDSIGRLGGVAHEVLPVLLQAYQQTEAKTEPWLRLTMERVLADYSSPRREHFECFRATKEGESIPSWNMATGAVRPPELNPEKQWSMNGWTVAVDEHCVFPGSQPHRPLEGRVVVLEKVGQLPAVILVQDCFTRGSVVHQFDVAAQAVAAGLGRGLGEISFFCFAGQRLEPVSFHKTELGLEPRWRGPVAAMEFFDAELEPLRDRLLINPLKLPGFVAFCEERLAQVRREAAAERERFQSPKGSVNYSSLNIRFGCSLRQRSEGAVPEALARMVAGYGDSLDGTVNPDLMATTFGAPVAEYLAEAIGRDPSAIVAGNVVPTALLNETGKDLYSIGDNAPPQANAILVDPIKTGVVLLRGQLDNSQQPQVLTNVPRTVYCGSNGYEWGYPGSGPQELAENILNLYVPPGSEARDPVERDRTYHIPKVRTFASATAVDFAGEFCRQIIAKIPKEGALISAQRIRDWIVVRLAERNARRD